MNDDPILTDLAFWTEAMRQATPARPTIIGVHLYEALTQLHAPWFTEAVAAGRIVMYTPPDWTQGLW